MPDPKVTAIPLRPSPNIHEGWVYILEVFSDHLEFNLKGKVYKTYDQRLLNKALTALAEMILE